MGTYVHFLTTVLLHWDQFQRWKHQGMNYVTTTDDIKFVTAARINT